MRNASRYSDDDSFFPQSDTFDAAQGSGQEHGHLQRQQSFKEESAPASCLELLCPSQERFLVVFSLRPRDAMCHLDPPCQNCHGSSNQRIYHGHRHVF